MHEDENSMFYDGSTVLEPLANAINLELDKINFIVCLFASLPLGYIYQQHFAPGKASREARSLFPLIFGILICFFCFGRAILHLLANCLISYCLMCSVAPKYVHIAVFVFSMGYLLWMHFYRWLVLDSYRVDVTAPIMVAVQKITTLAFSLHDGMGRPPEHLSELQKREATTSAPPLLDYMSYMLNFQTGFTGPFNYYPDYCRFLDGTDIPKDGSNISASLKKISYAMVFLVIIVMTMGKYPPEILMRKEYLELPTYSWLFYWYLSSVLVRMNYYFVWTFAEGVCNMSGYGFSGYDEQKQPKWDLCCNVKPFNVEFAQSFKEVLDNWNIQTAGWLRRLAYDRTPSNSRVFVTYLLSAIWHGVSIGYYMTFLSAAVFTPAANTFRRCMRWRFLGDPQKKLIYDIFTMLTTMAGLTYVTYPFITMNFNPAFSVYRRVFFCGHFIAFGMLFLLPQVFPPPNGEKSCKTASITKSLEKSTKTARS